MSRLTKKELTEDLENVLFDLTNCQVYDGIKYLGDILDDEDKWDEIDEYHNFLKSELNNLVYKIK